MYYPGIFFGFNDTESLYKCISLCLTTLIWRNGCVAVVAGEFAKTALRCLIKDPRHRFGYYQRGVESADYPIGCPLGVGRSWGKEGGHGE